MNLNEYQQKAMTTCMPSSENFSYMFLNLVGEVGELASKVAKDIRRGNAYISGSSDLYFNDFPELSEQERELFIKFKEISTFNPRGIN